MLESLELYYCTNGSATASSPVRLPRLSSVTIYRWNWSNKDVVLYYVSRDRDTILFKDFSKSDSQIQQSSAQNWALLLLLTFLSIVPNFSRSSWLENKWADSMNHKASAENILWSSISLWVKKWISPRWRSPPPPPLTELPSKDFLQVDLSFRWSHNWKL